MKIAISILSILVLIIVSAFFVIFTPYGSNTVLKPIINSKIQAKIVKPKIVVEKFDSKISYLDVAGNVDNMLKFRALGDVNYFKKSFALNYTLDAKKIAIEGKEYKPNMHIKGSIAGNIKHFKLNGEGKAFGSNLDYSAIVANSEPRAIKANIKDAKVAQILAMSGISPIVSGIANVDINMPNLDLKNPQGRAYVELNKGLLNRKVIKREYGIVIPKNEHINARVAAKVVNKYIVAKGKIVTTSAKLNLQKLTTTPNFKVSKGQFSLDIPKLSRLNATTKMDLKGKLKADGLFYLNLPKRIYQANVKTKSFGGLAKIKYKSNSVNAILKQVNIVKVLSTLSQPHFVTSGFISGVVDIPNLQKLNGSFTIKSKGVVNKRLFKVNLPSYKYIIKTQGSLKNGVIYAKKSILDSSIARVLLTNSKFTIVSSALTTNFDLFVNRLEALNSITGQNLRGKLLLKGVLKKAGKSMTVSASTASFGGNAKIDYSGSKLKLLFKNISLPKLFYKLNQPAYLTSGFTTGNVKLTSLSPINGLLNITANGLVNNKVVNRLYNINLDKQLKYKMSIKDGVISKGVLKIKPRVISSLFNLDFSSLVYNLNSGSMSGSYILDILDLSQFNSLAKQNLTGSAKVQGKISYRGKNFIVSGLINKFGGTTNFYLKGDNFTLNGAGINVIEVLAMLNKPKNVDGVVKVDLQYNLASKKGSFSANIDEVRFLNSKLVASLKKFLNFDLSKEVFKSAIINGTIDGDIVRFNLNSSSNKVAIVINNGVMNTKNQTISARAKVTYKGKDYYIKIGGKSDDPSFRLEFKGAVKDKVVNVVKKRVLGKLGLDGNSTTAPNDALKKADEKVEKLEDKAKEKVKKAIPKEVKGLLNGLFK